VSGQGRKILVVTDNLSVGAVSVRYLTKKGYAVSAASDLKSAVAAFMAEAPHLVILDDFENGQGSLKILNVLRQLEEGGAKAAVLMAGSITWDASVEAEAKRLGVARFLFEPFNDMPSLHDLIAETIGRGEGKAERPARRSESPRAPGEHRASPKPHREEPPGARPTPAPAAAAEQALGEVSEHFSVKSASFNKVGRVVGSLKAVPVKPTAAAPAGPPPQDKAASVGDGHAGATPAASDPPAVDERRAQRAPEPQPKAPEPQPKAPEPQPKAPEPQPAAPEPPPKAAELAAAPTSAGTGQGRLAQRSVPNQGDLSAAPMAELLTSIYLEKASGELVLSNGSVKKTVRFDKGSPASVDSNVPSEMLVAHLERSFKLPKERRLAIERERGSDGSRDVALLIQHEWANPNELFELLSEYVVESVIACFAWEEGQFAFTRGATSGGGAVGLRLDFPRVILDGIRRHYSLARLGKLMPLSNDSELAVFDNGPVTAESLKLTTSEARVLELGRSGETFGVLLSKGTRVNLDFLGTLYFLYLVGVMGFKDQGGKAPRASATTSPPSGLRRPGTSAARRPTPRPASASSSPSPAAGKVAKTPGTGKTPPPPTPSAEAVSPEEALARELESLADADYFKLLGVARDATIETIHGAFKMQVKRLHPDKLTKLPKDAQELGVKVYRRLVDGFRVVTSPEQREQYLIELKKAELTGTHKVPAAVASAAEAALAKDNANQRLDAIMERAIGLVQGERYSAAVSMLHNALTEPVELCRIHAWLGWALYLQSPDKNLGEAESQLAEARRSNPSLPEPYLFIARIREREGSSEQAQRYYQKASEVAPRDREMLKELKEFEKRLASGKLLTRPKETAKRAGPTPKAKDDASKGLLDQDVGGIIKSLFKKK
jgi:CheY-like chemotaxis protein/curved DNA-binding protein CbpA